jgi:proteasome maturation protein
MDPQAGLQQLYYPQDPLRAGLTHLKDAATPNHPLEHALKQQEAHKAEAKKNLLRNTQGIHAAMRVSMEQTILSQYRRLPGFHSEFMGLEVMNSSMTNVGVEDILNGSYQDSLSVSVDGRTNALSRSWAMFCRMLLLP